MELDELIKEYLGYEPDTGIVVWLKNPNPATRAIKPGDIAGRLHPFGYHANGIKNDDRLVNLREATASENSRNRKSRGNETGVKGVQFSKNRYIASVTVRGEYHYVGCFTDLKSAEIAVKATRERLHKEFTNHG